MNKYTKKVVKKMDKNINALFTPHSIAVIGASDKEGTVGHSIIKNLLYGKVAGRYRVEGYPEEIYVVNRRKQSLGMPTYASVLDIPADEIDLAVISVPAKYVPQVMDECGQKKARAAIVISAGFSEIGGDGTKLEDEVVRIAQRYGIRVLGPNCLGMMNLFTRLNATFTDEMPMLGPISFITQSGALCAAVINYANEKKIGFSNFVSIGDKADIDDSDLLEYFERDPHTRCIAIYVESFKDGRKFFETAFRVNKTTPIVVLKSGKTEAGARAASSHTGSMAGSDSAYDAAFRQAGVYRVNSLESLFDCARALGYQPIPKSDRVAILTNSGGPGVLSADKAAEIGMRLADLAPETVKKLNDHLPAAWSHSNPIDILGDAGPVRFKEVLEILVEAGEVDSIIVILTPLTISHPYIVSGEIVEIAKKSTKPILANYVGIISEVSGRYLDEHGVPEISWPERTVQAMHSLTARANFLNFEAKLEIPEVLLDHGGKLASIETVIEESQREGRDLREMIETREILDMPEVLFDMEGKRESIETVIEEARRDGRELLTLIESREILEMLGVPLTKGVLLRSIEDVGKFAGPGTDGERVPFPVAMKIVSKQITHKTDAGGVRIGIASESAARAAFDEIVKNAKAYDPDVEIEGIWMEEMIHGSEFIVGTTVDPTFGKMIMFGLGGIFVEVFKDVAFRLVPIHVLNAEAMVDSIRSKPILEGARGMPVVDRKALEEMIVHVSDLVHNFPIKEMDINPLVVTKDGLKAIDARIVVESDG